MRSEVRAKECYSREVANEASASRCERRRERVSRMMRIVDEEMERNGANTERGSSGSSEPVSERRERAVNGENRAGSRAFLTEVTPNTRED